MSEMVERVARAIGGPWFDGEPEAVVSNYPGQTAKYREHYRALARAAIEAMREPTDELLTVGAHQFDDDWCSETNALHMWNAMVAEALKP